MFLWFLYTIIRLFPYYLWDYQQILSWNYLLAAFCRHFNEFAKSHDVKEGTRTRTVSSPVPYHGNVTPTKPIGLPFTLSFNSVCINTIIQVHVHGVWLVTKELNIYCIASSQIVVCYFCSFISAHIYLCSYNMPEFICFSC